MKLSKYNILKCEDNGELLIYNTITSAILNLEKNYAESYQRITETGVCDREDLQGALIEGGMLVDEEKDEMKDLLVKHAMERFSDSALTLTIAPTLACNFCCPYCYEQGREYISMSEQVQDDLISELSNKYSHIRDLTVSWYGGEPLLALDIIERLTARIKANLSPHCEYNADMVTNGYNLTREVAKKLQDLDVKYVQITIDGSKKAHDSRRILHSGAPTFERILSNIKDAVDILNISIRINVDKTNISEAVEIFDWLEKYQLKGKVGYYLAPVDDINGVCNSKICIERPDYAKEEIAFYNEGIKRGFLYNGVKPTNYGVCGAISLNSFVIGPDGEVYKCWNDIGYSERSIGNLRNGIKLNNKFVEWLSYKPVKCVECNECGLFPVCFGGCAAFKEKNCTSMKWNVEDVLSLMKRACNTNG